MRRSGSARGSGVLLSFALVVSTTAARGEDAAPPAAVAPDPVPAPLELGLFGGALFPSRSHELLRRGPYQPYVRAAPEIGTRFSFFPLPELGLELEGAVAPSETVRGDAAGFWAARAHASFRLSRGRLALFSVLGFGVLGAASNQLGSDADPAVHVGLGAAFALDEFVGLRLDLRDTLTQKYGVGAGVQTHHPEILLGVSFGMRPEVERTP